jgi:hypothetical protein
MSGPHRRPPQSQHDRAGGRRTGRRRAIPRSLCRAVPRSPQLRIAPEFCAAPRAWVSARPPAPPLRYSAVRTRRFRYLDLLTIGFVVVLLIESGGAEDLPDRSLAGERGGAAFSHHLYMWRRFHRGVWIRRIAAGDLDRPLRHGAAFGDGRGRGWAAAGAGLAQPAGFRQPILWSHLTKVIYETVATPATCAVVAWLKRAEQADAFDRETGFNPFTLRTRRADPDLPVES